ncbi:hypothetical protein D9M69_592370 [compost metagenome]
MVAAPVDLGKPQPQPAQRAADRDVGQAQVDAAAKGLVAQALGHGGHAGLDLGALALDPGGAALGVGAAGPGGFEAPEHAGVHDAVGQRFPGLDLGALAALLRNELAHGRQGVDVFDDDARVEHRLAAFHDQARHLAQRVRMGDRGVCGPDVFDHELVVEPLFGQHHAHLAHIRAGGGSDQFHEGSLPIAC